MIFQDPYNSFHPTYTIFEQIKDVVKIEIIKDEVR
jgi:peptide/nickel transport system ATP-binding protein